LPLRPTTTFAWAMRRPSSSKSTGEVELVVEFDYDSGAEGKHIAQQHAAASETKFDVEADIHEAAVAGRWRGLGQRRFLRTLRRLISRLKLRGEGWADLNFEGDDFMGGRRAGLRLRSRFGSRRWRPRTRRARRRREMKLHFAAGAWCESGGSKAGDLAQQFLQGFLAFRRDGFGRRGFRRRSRRRRFHQGTSGRGWRRRQPADARSFRPGWRLRPRPCTRDRNRRRAGVGWRIRRYRVFPKPEKANLADRFSRLRTSGEVRCGVRGAGWFAAALAVSSYFHLHRFTLHRTRTCFPTHGAPAVEAEVLSERTRAARQALTRTGLAEPSGTSSTARAAGSEAFREKGQQLAGREVAEFLQGHLQAGHGEFHREEALEKPFLNLPTGFGGAAAALVAEVGRHFSEQRVRNHGRDGEVEGAAVSAILISKLRPRFFFFGGHQALRLQDGLARAEIEFQRNRVPAVLQFAKHDANDAFQNLFFDFGEVASGRAVRAFPPSKMSIRGKAMARSSWRTAMAPAGARSQDAR